MDSINVSDFLGDKGRFEDIEQLDRCGTTSLAYKVRIHNQLLFMKKLRPEFSNDESYRLLFYKEFNTGKTIKSPYVVDYVEINDDEEGLYILMEYVSGSTLKQKIEREPEYFLQEENVWKLLLHLCEAVKALHHENVLHLDISPDNLMLSQTNGDLKLLDLGFCLSNFDDTTPGFKAGFCAPEVNLRDSKEVDARTDIYSVGIILKYIQDKRGKQFRGALRRIMKRCLSDEKAKRYATIDALLVDVHGRDAFKRKAVLIGVFPLVLLLLISLAFVFNGGGKDVERELITGKFEAQGFHCRVINPEARTVSITYKGETDDEFFYEYGDGVIEVPATITYRNQTFRVVSIDGGAFDNPETTKIILPDGLETIQSQAFSICRLTGTVVIPKSVKQIGSMVYEGNVFIDSILVDKDNRVYDSRNNCNAIIETATNTLLVASQNTVIPADVTSLGDYAYMLYQKPRLVIPTNVERIGEGCFFRSALKEIVLHDRIKTIAPEAFQKCERLSSINLPVHLKVIESYAFQSSGLQTVKISNSVTTIGAHAFADCKNLQMVEIGQGVVNVEAYAFQKCERLTKVISHIPADKLTPTGSGAFNDINKKCILYVPRGAKTTYLNTIGWNQFSQIREMDM